MSSLVTPDKPDRAPAVSASQQTVIHTGSTNLTDTNTISPASTYEGSTTGDSIPLTSSALIANGIIDKIQGLGIIKSQDGAQVAKKATPYTPPAASFVIQSSQSRIEDPFRSASKNGDSSAQKNGRCSTKTTPSSRHGEALNSINWRSGSSSSDDNSDSPTARKSTMKDIAMRTRSSKDPGINSDRVSNRNAQSIYPPSACVFVANLFKGADEETLEYLVTRKFREYGTVWVKIRRDPRDMPFAFCQFTNDADAERALKEGRGAIICERPVRTEKAKANRAFYMSRIDGRIIKDGEARMVVADVGPLSRTWKPSSTERALYHLSEGIFIEFMYYEDGRDAMLAFRDNEVYRLEQLHALDQVSVRRSDTNSSSVASQYLQRYDVDRRSVFIGNLPQGITRGDLKQIFGVHGEIAEVEVISRESIHEGMPNNVFAFIEFESDAAVQPAIASKHGFEINGNYIKVFQKDSDGGNRRTARETSERRHPTSRPGPAQPPSQPRTPAAPVKDSNSLETLQPLIYNGPSQPAIRYQPPASTMTYQPAPVYTYQYAPTPYYVPFYYDSSAITSQYMSTAAYNQALATGTLTVQPYTYAQSTPDATRPYVPMTGSEVYYAPYSPAGCAPTTTEATAEDRAKTPTPQTYNAEEDTNGVAGNTQ